VDPDALGTKLSREIAHRAFKSRLHRTHEVVILNDHLRAVIGHGRESTPLLHQGLGELGHADERPTGNIHGLEKALSRAIHHTPLQIRLRRESNRVQANVELAPLRSDLLEHSFQLAFDLEIERHEDRRAELLSERLDIRFCFVVEIGDGEIGAESMQRLRAAIGD
jgi:hypothetical protein